MHKPHKRRWWQYSLLATFLMLLGFVVYTANMSFRSSDEATQRYFAKRSVQVDIHYIDYAGGTLRYITTGLRADTAPVVMWVHGAPGSGNADYAYLSDSMLLHRARLITLDRPGYGYSHYGRSEPRLAGQAAAVKAVLDQYPLAVYRILVGHSFGGPIAAQTALDYPDAVDALMMLAPVNDPDSEPLPWYAHLARWRATRWMMSKAWCVSGDEKFAHQAQLRLLQPRWKDLRIPVVHLHGESDFLAPPEANIAFSRRHIPDTWLKMVVIPGGGHFIPWANHDLVRNELLLLLP